MFALVYVDDILITGNCVSVINSFKKLLDNKFKIKNLSILHYFLSIDVVSTDDSICFNRKKYAMELILEYGQSACKPALVPID